MANQLNATVHTVRPGEQAVHIAYIGAGGFGEIHMLIRAFAGNISEDDIKKEARTIEKLGRTSHDNIIRIFDHGRFSLISPMYFIDMELCETDLEEYMSVKKQGIRGLIDWDVARNEGQREFIIVAIVQQLLGGLAYVHKHNMVHRDMAPQNVLYHAASGWWKIADFGLTSTATSRRLNSTSGARGKPCYRAPELLREENSGFNKKVDIWSLGCILFELCIGRKAFQDDFDTFQYSAGQKTIAIDFPDWFDLEIGATLKSLVEETLHPDHEKRPSVISICSKGTELISQLRRLGSSELFEFEMYGEEFIESKYILGTEAPSEEGYHSLRWEVGYPGYDKDSRGSYIERCRQTMYARERMLGMDHPNTFWSRMCLGWAMISAGLDAVNVFTEASDVAIKSGNPHVSSKFGFAQFGLGWVESEISGRNILEELFSIDDKRLARAAKIAMARKTIHWYYDDESQKLEQILKQQKMFLNDGHPDMLETRTLQAMVKLFEPSVESTSEARTLLDDIALNSTRLYRIEHPALLTLCNLAWAYARKSYYQREAIRIFKEAEAMQRKLLGLEYPTTTGSLEALATVLSQGPIIWPVESVGKSKGNNRSGSRGLLKCHHFHFIHLFNYPRMDMASAI